MLLSSNGYKALLNPFTARAGCGIGTNKRLRSFATEIISTYRMSHLSSDVLHHHVDCSGRLQPSCPLLPRDYFLTVHYQKAGQRCAKISTDKKRVEEGDQPESSQVRALPLCGAMCCKLTVALGLLPGFATVMPGLCPHFQCPA